MPVDLLNAIPPPPPKPRYQPLVLVLVAAVVGILLDRFWPLPLWAWWTAATCGLAIWLPAAWRARVAVGSFALLLGRGGHGRRVAPLPLVSVRRRRLGPLCAAQGPADLHRGRGGRIATRCCRPQPPDPMQMMPPGEGCAVRRRSGLAAQRRDVAAGLRPGNAVGDGEPPTSRPATALRCFGTLSAPDGPQNPGAVRPCRLPRGRSGAEPAPGRSAGVHLRCRNRLGLEPFAAARSGSLTRQSAAGAIPEPATGRIGRRRAAWACEKNSTPSGTRPFSPPARSMSFASPACTSAFWPARCSGSCGERPSRAAGPWRPLRRSRCSTR